MPEKPVAALVSTDWLARHAGDAGLAIIELRVPADGGRTAYEAGHVPGAVFSDYAGDGWRLKRGDVPGLRPTGEHLAGLFARLGIRPQSHVVLVPVGSGANDLAASARAFWTLRHAGHAAVSILDGGTARWHAEGRPLEIGWREPVGAAHYPVSFREGFRAEAPDVLDACSRGTAALVDARAASYFSGREKAGEARRAGHIPGAISADYAGLFDPARHGLKPVDDLGALLAHVPAGPVISYCNTGHTAALDWFVLSEVLGRPDVLLYDGSMTDWTQDDSRPVAAG